MRILHQDNIQGLGNTQSIGMATGNQGFNKGKITLDMQKELQTNEKYVEGPNPNKGKGQPSTIMYLESELP